MHPSNLNLYFLLHKITLQFISERKSSSGRQLLSLAEQEVNCTPAAINEFPSDGFTREQRQHGWVIIHIVLACYCFTLLAIVCDDFFVPAIRKFCDSKNFIIKNMNVKKEWMKTKKRLNK